MYSINSKTELAKGSQFLRRLLESGKNKIDHKQDVIPPADTSEAAYYANIIQFIPHLIYGRDQNGVYTVVNQAFADFAGKKIHEIIGKTDKELMIFLNPDQIRMTDESLFEKKQKRFIPLEPFTESSGELYWFQTVKNPVYDEAGEVTEVLNISTDITKRVEMEQRLSQSEIRYRSIFENNYSGIIVIDKDLSIHTKNKAFDALMGEDHEASNDGDLKSYVNETDKRDLLDLLNGLSSRNYEFFDIDVQLTANDGRKIDTICFVRGLYDANLNFTEAVITFQDVTKVREQQKQLEESEERFRTIVENATEALLLLDFDQKKYVDANRSAETLFGYSREEFRNLSFGDLSPKGQANGESVVLGEDYMNRAISGERLVYEWEVRRKDGTKLICEVRLVKLPYPDRNIIRTSVVDITDRKRAERLLNNEKRKLQESNKELIDLNFKLGNQTKQLQEFAYIASHNLRSPAGNIRALLDFYQADPSEENLNFLLEKLDVVATDLMDTINDLAEVVKIKNEVSKEHTSIELQKVMEKVKDSLSEAIKNKNAVINYDFTGVEKIYGPKTYVESIFLNLTSNAIKYSKDDVPAIIDIVAEKTENHFCITVKDNGLGIDLKKHGSKLFGLRKTFHRDKDSRGVGLFITKAQVESLGGTIKVESEPNVGSSFMIEFPLSILEKKQ
ncbi:PAS domain S-box protein [bacterium]|nr:PAS domain S-box protein [bacterium]